MRKWFVVLAFLLLAGCNSEPSEQNSAEVSAGSEVNEQVPVKTHDTISITREQIHEGNLVLVNKNNPIDEIGVPSDIIKLSENTELIKSFTLLDNTLQLSATITEEFKKMVDAAGLEGVNHFMISSGYRDNVEQEKLYKEKGAEYALPAGYSEHNVGLSMDIGSTLKPIDQAPEGEWLKENAWDYGFILRYPVDKSDITGIQYEPWHFRYVGLPHSQIMKEKQFTLEEYTDFLKQQKEFIYSANGMKYTITYIPESENMSIEVPLQGQYEISGNNVDGVIVTIAIEDLNSPENNSENTPESSSEMPNN